jgi:hypothetical protein
MTETIISGVAVGLILVLINLIIKKDKDRKKQLEDISLLQQTHTKEIKCMNKEVTLARIDSACAVYALRKASNGIKFSEFIEEERDRLVAFYNIQYKD